MEITPAAQPSKGSKKVKGPQTSTSKHRSKITKLAPPLPARPSASSHPSTRPNGTHATLPLKTLQGKKTKRTDTTKDGWDREVVFVTRNTPLGALMGRCRSLIMDEGYTRIRLHALAAAIPHALLLLHALLDILPYPQGDKGMWYEIRTGSTECIEEVKAGGSSSTRSEGGRSTGKGLGKGKEKPIEDEDIGMDSIETPAHAEEDDIDIGDIGGIEEQEPTRIAKLKASIEIDLHIGPKKSITSAITAKNGPTKRSRPGKKKRELLKRAARGGEGDEENGEEEAMNEMIAAQAFLPTKIIPPHRASSTGSTVRPRVMDTFPDEEEEEEELENR